MRPEKFWIRSLVVASMLAFGCNSKSPVPTGNTSEEGGGAAAVAMDGGNNKKRIVPVKQNVKEIEGNWVFVLTSNRRDSYRWIINFSRGADGKIVGQFIDTSQDKDEHDKPEIVSTDIDDNSIKFVIKNSHETFDFAGALQSGFIRGTSRWSPVELLTTRLLPTDEKSLEKFGATALPPGSDVFESLMKSKDASPEKLLMAMLEYRTSPLTQDMFAMLMASHIQAKFDEAKLTNIIDAYLATSRFWGSRWESRIELTIAVNLINGRQFSRLAIPHLDAAEKLLGEDLPALQESLNTYREAATINDRIQDLTSTSTTEEVRTAANVELTELLKKQPYNPEILSALAIQAERIGQADIAIEYLSDIVALPLLEVSILRLRAGLPPDTPTPGELLKKLWVQKHGSEDGYASHLNDVYHAKLGAMVAEMRQKAPAVPAGDAGSKTVLVEMFTGMQCAPCVAADLALTGLSKSFPSTQVIVVRYHQHIPMPDGLANQDSEERAAFYEVASTPAVIVDGQVIDPRFYSGPIQAAPGGYSVFRQIIDPRLAEKSEIAMQLSGTVVDGLLTASAEVTGIPEDLLPSCRLRMAIVENSVHAYAPLMTNGIRDHEFVVRDMLGIAKGIPPKRGELKYSISIKVADLKQNLVDYVSRFEAGRRAEFPAELKPPIQGPLSLVAWVQNGTPDKDSRSKLVLQAAMVPLTGDPGLGEAVKTEPRATDAAGPTTSTPADAENETKANATKEGPGVTPSPPALPE